MSTPSHAIALLVIAETKSKEYIDFKQTFQRASAGQVRIIDIDGVKKMKGNKYVDKLNNTLKNCHAIVVICSKTLKVYLDNGKDSKNDLLKSDERKALLQGFKEHEKKVILVTLSNEDTAVPTSVQALGNPINGVTDTDTVSDRVTAKLFAR